MRSPLLSLLAMCVVSVAAGQPAMPHRERILDFHSDVTVHADASLTVTETIKVDVHRRTIRHGIYRDFPTRYRLGNLLSGQQVVPFEVVKVLRDGRPEPYRLQNLNGGKRVTIGKEDALLPVGMHTYELTYRTDRQLGTFADRDELSWNVTGNDWQFPIEQASATVHLPAGVPAGAIQIDAFTGPFGAQGKDYQGKVSPNGSIDFHTTRSLPRGEGLTIVVAWPKGFVAEPTSAQKLGHFLADNRIVLVALLGLLVLFGYCFVVRRLMGPELSSGMIVPQPDPPEDLSPAALRFIRRMRFDSKCLVVAVVNLAVRGYLTIEQNDRRQFTLRKCPDASADRLPPLERELADKLLGLDGEVSTEPRNHPRFRQAAQQLKEDLANAYQGRYFVVHWRLFIVGIVLTVLALLLTGVTAALEGRPEIAFLLVWLTGWTCGVAFLAVSVWKTWKQAKNGLGKGVALGLSLFALPFFAAELAALGMLAWMTSILLPLVLVGLGGLIILLYQRIRQPTAEGRLLMDAIEGFRAHLTEGHEDAALAGGERQTEWFERYLPHAMALDVEEVWSSRLATTLDQASEGPSRVSMNRPIWFHGPIWDSSPAGFPARFSSAFSSSFASASSTGSSSGGGGFSGGGRGGGGGGGW